MVWKNEIGGVVTSTERIMTIVLEGTPLAIEVMGMNKDIEFIENA